MSDISQRAAQLLVESIERGSFPKLVKEELLNWLSKQEMLNLTSLEGAVKLQIQADLVEVFEVEDSESNQHRSEIDPGSADN